MENSFDSYFDKLDEINEIVKSEERCCDKKENHIIDDGMITCKNCNMIINNIMDTPEWRNYKDSSNNPTRCGMPTNALLPQSSLGTNISNKGGNNEKMNKVNMYRGSNRIGIIAACIYYACKECNVPRSTSELASLFDINTKVMTKGCKNFTEIMRISNCDKNRIQSHRSINLYDFVERFCHKLKFNEDNILHIKEIAKICDKLSLINDNTPPAMSSGCIYLYIKNKNIDISKKHISDICKISEVTINKCSKKIENIKEIDDYLNSI